MINPQQSNRGLNRRQFLSGILATGAAASSCSLLAQVSAGSSSERPPNILFILSDDLGWMDTAVYGSTYYQTPNVDALAKRGKLFTRAYAMPVCSPTRASVLTGQNAGRLGFSMPAGHYEKAILKPKLVNKAHPYQKVMQANIATRLDNSLDTYAEALKRVGYTTAFMGKWHLGRAPHIPENQGFDQVIGGGHSWGPPGGYFAPWSQESLPEAPDGTHITDLLTDEAIGYLETRAKEDKPFLLNLWYYDVHSPFQAKEDLIAKHKARIDLADTQRCPTMAAMIETMDKNIGRVIEALDRLKLAENTVVIFSSDNGGHMYKIVDGTTPTNNAPLQNGKGSIYEGGVRIPMIVAWPGKIEPGTTCNDLVSCEDYYPTLLEIAGAKPAEGQPIDGMSILPLLKSEGTLSERTIVTHFPRYISISDGVPCTSVHQLPWKLIRFYHDNPDQTHRYELYNVVEDLGETRNLADSYPKRVKAMDAMIERYLKETGALVPKVNPAYDPKVVPPESLYHKIQRQLAEKKTGP